MVIKAKLDLSALTSVLEDDAPMTGAENSEQIHNIQMDIIKPGKYQPRRHFDEKTLQELADSIKQEGLLQPIVVLPKNAEGFYEIIAGERRYRAHQLNGASTIKALIYDKLSIYASFTENMQRDNLSFDDTVTFISDRLKAGDKVSEIAKNTGLDKALLSKYASFIDRPEAIDRAYKAGLVTGVLNTYELGRLMKSYPAETEQWIDELLAVADVEPITARQINYIRARFDAQAKVFEKKNDATQQTNEVGTEDTGINDSTQDNDEGQGGDYDSGESGVADNEDSEHYGKKSATEPKEKDPNKLSKAVILCVYDDRECTLEYKQKPSTSGFVWIKYENGETVEVVASKLKIDSIIEG